MTDKLPSTATLQKMATAAAFIAKHWPVFLDVHKHYESVGLPSSSIPEYVSGTPQIAMPTVDELNAAILRLRKRSYPIANMLFECEHDLIAVVAGLPKCASCASPIGVTGKPNDRERRGLCFACYRKLRRGTLAVPETTA